MCFNRSNGGRKRRKFAESPREARSYFSGINCFQFSRQGTQEPNEECNLNDCLVLPPSVEALICHPCTDSTPISWSQGDPTGGAKPPAFMCFQGLMSTLLQVSVSFKYRIPGSIASLAKSLPLWFYPYYCRSCCCSTFILAESTPPNPDALLGLTDLQHRLPEFKQASELQSCSVPVGSHLVWFKVKISKVRFGQKQSNCCCILLGRWAFGFFIVIIAYIRYISILCSSVQ